jgi:hypothetical protein
MDTGMMIPSFLIKYGTQAKKSELIENSDNTSPV